MDKSIYKALAALYKEYGEKLQALHDEIKERMLEIDTEGRIYALTLNPWVHLCADKPSEGARYGFGNNSVEFYVNCVDGVTFVEMIEKND